MWSISFIWINRIIFLQKEKEYPALLPAIPNRQVAHILPSLHKKLTHIESAHKFT